MRRICEFAVVRSLDGIKAKASVVIYGAGGRGHILYESIKNKRPDINIICYLDDSVSKSQNGVPVFNYEIAKNKFDWDHVLIASIHSREIIEKLDINESAIVISNTAMHEFPARDRISFWLLIKNLYKIWRTYNFLSDFASRELYLQILQQRIFGFGYADRIYAAKMFSAIQYFEYINKDAIVNVLDAGVHDGFTSFQFLNKFENIKKIYGFDLSDDALVGGLYSDLLLGEQFTLCLSPLADSKYPVYILLDKKNPSASKIQKEKIEGGIMSNSITIDSFCEENRIKMDFLKFDIEGAEGFAIIGAKKVLETDRPQVAISIYHSPEDFINIPYHLIRTLKNYNFYLGHYSLDVYETVLYAIPKELVISY